MRRVAIIGDRTGTLEPQEAIEPALAHAAEARGYEHPRATWIATDDLAARGAAMLDGADGIWFAPGSPCRSLEGALVGIRQAREQRVPFLGTCAGFQHAVIEFARNVLGHENAAHAEYGDAAPDAELFIDELLCSLAGQTMKVDIVDERLAAIYGASVASERYYCRFGLHPDWHTTLHDAGLRIAGVDARDQDVRILRLEDHPFFLGTLFVPQTSSRPKTPHPLVTAFVASL